MDPSTLSQLLKGTLDPSFQQQAEEELKKIHKIIGFSPGLLSIIMSNDVEIPIRQAGTVYLKNYISAHWASKDDDSSPLNSFSLHEQDRGVLKDNLIRAIVSAPDVIQSQLALIVSTIIKHDFPSQWPSIVEQISLCLTGSGLSTMHGALLALYQLVKNYEYKKREERSPLYDAMNFLLPLLHDIMTSQISEQSPESTAIKKLILKIFFAFTQYVLPLEVLHEDTFTKWMEIFKIVIELEIPSHTLSVDEEERPQLIWWKVKKWSLHILTRLFERYGSPGSVSSEYAKFSLWYIKTFSVGILTSVMKVLEYIQNNVYVSPRVTQLALNYLNTSVAHAVSWSIVKPYMGQVVQFIIFPLMSYTSKDAELWETDPYEYVRVKFDIFEDFVSPITAAQTLLHSLCKKRKGMLSKVMSLLLSIVQAPETNDSQKDGALHMIGTMADILLKKKTYKDQMEEFLINIVFKEFSSPYGHLRARACWMLHYFAQVQYNNNDVLAQAICLTIRSFLEDKEIPVKVEAAITLQMILSSHEEKAKPFIENKITEITLELLRVIRETENDDLTSVMQKIICSCTEQVIPVALDVCKHLVETFARVLESIEVSDDKAITAMSLLNTLETLLCVMEDKSIHEALEPIVLQAVHHIFSNSILEFYEEAFSLTCNLTSTKVSPCMWNMLESIYAVFSRDGFDYFTDMMPTLHNYVTIDTESFVSNPSFISAIFNMSKRMLECEPGENAECHGAKMLEVIILQCKGQTTVDKFLPSFIEVIFLRLRREIKTSELRTMCLQVAIAAMYSNSSIFFETLQSMTSVSGGSRCFISQFIEQWISDTDCFIGLHDRKICVIGLCQLMTMPNLPGLETHSHQILPSLLLLFDGLKRAYEARSSGSESSSDEETDDEDRELLNSDEDEIDEDSSLYLENLQKMIHKNNSSGFDIRSGISNEGSVGVSTGARAVTGAGDDDDDNDSEDYDGYEETPLESYTTPFDEDDTIDEYIIFKKVFTSLEKDYPAWHHKLLEKLSPNHFETLNDVFTQAAQRQASQDSENIKKAGGYNFAQQTVPGQFNFGSENTSFAFGK